MRGHLAILDGHTVVPVGDGEEDVIRWGKWFDTAERHVGLDIIGDARVSTVFLGINHGGYFGEPDLWFETMVFGIDDEYTERYTTWEEAKTGHDHVVSLIRKGMPLRPLLS